MLLFFVLYTLGELFILPLGLAMFGLFAPRSLAATTMSAWFATAFVGSLLAGRSARCGRRSDRQDSSR